MSVSANYPEPVQVNGFTCRNCTDVDFAKKHIDPAHPKSGPYDVNAATDPTQTAAARFAGGLSGAQVAPGTVPSVKATGGVADLSA